MLLNVCWVSINIQHITIEIVFVFCKLLRECMYTLIANSEFVRNFSYDFKAVPCVSLPFTTASVFRKWSGFGVTLHLTLLDMRLEHVHCSVTFCSLKITQMLGPVWLCSLGEAGCLAIFISTPRNPPHTHTHPALPLSGSATLRRAVVSVTLLVLKSDTFPASWPVVEAVRACLQLASVNHGSAAWCITCRTSLCSGTQGLCTVWSPRQCSLSPASSHISSVAIHTHITPTCTCGFLDIVTHFNTSADVWFCGLPASFIT